MSEATSELNESASSESSARFFPSFLRSRWTVLGIVCLALAVIVLTAIDGGAESRLIERIRQAGGDVDVSRGEDRPLSSSWSVRVPLSRLLNPKRVRVYVGSGPDPDAVLKYAAKLRRIDNLWLLDSHVTAKGLQYLPMYRSVGLLSVQGTPITDDDLQYVARMPSLECFQFARTQTTAEGIRKLGKAMPTTQMLDANPLMDQQERELRSVAPSQ